MRKMKTTILIAVAFAVFAQVANAKECTQMEAYAAETVTDYLDSWKNVSRVFRDFGHCDDGGIAEGFDEAISALWANQWQKLPEMLKYTKENKEFRNFIYKRIRSETVPVERWQKILKKAQNECPKGGKELCAEIIMAGKTTPNHSAADATVLTEKSYGPVTFGNSLKTIEKRIGEKAKGETGDKGCDFVIFKKFPGIKFMVEDGIVTRADAVSPEIKNKQEINIGTSLEAVKRRYPMVEVKPHKYDPKGHYLIFKSKDGKRAILFEEDEGKITDTRAGLEPSVEYVEGCL